MNYNEHETRLLEKVLDKLNWDLDDNSKTGLTMWMDEIEVTKAEINAIPQILSKIHGN